MHRGVDEGWVPPKVHCNLLMSMCCNVSKILHIKVVLWEDNQTDLIGLQTTWISSSIIKLMLNTFTEFVSKTNLNLYNKIWYKELSCCLIYSQVWGIYWISFLCGTQHYLCMDTLSGQRLLRPSEDRRRTTQHWWENTTQQSGQTQTFSHLTLIHRGGFASFFAEAR